MSNGLKAFLGAPVEFKGKCWVYPPKVKDLMVDGFALYDKLLTLSQEDLDDAAAENGETSAPTPLEYLLSNSYKDPKFEKLVKDAFTFFIHEDVTFLYDTKTILIGNLESQLKTLSDIRDLNFINEDEYFDFQNVVRSCVGQKEVERPDPNEHPKIRRMKALARKRDRVKAKKQPGLSLEASICAICCMGIGITPLNVGEISYKAVQDLIHAFQEREAYDFNLKAVLAGGTKGKELTHWIRNLDK